MSDLIWEKEVNGYKCDVHSYCMLLVKYNDQYGDWSWSVWDRGRRIGSWRNKYNTEDGAKNAAIEWAMEQGALSE